MNARLINTDNDDFVNLIHKKGSLQIDKSGNAKFRDMTFVVADREENGNIITLHSPWYFYKFSVIKCLDKPY